MATSDAPLSINTVSLLVRNRQEIERFYCDILGMNLIRSNGDVTTLGQGNKPLLHLYEDSKAQSLPEEAGLFHTAFLLPDRSCLGSWLKHASENGIKLDGASDHLVSEALYLHDPEGNGIEVYVDRDRKEWRYVDDAIVMDTMPLNLNSVLSAAKTSWQGMPDDTVIGHVHLQVGDIATADSFYRDELGMERMAHRPQASFYASGRYHHHLAANTWNSAGAGKRTHGAAGLLQVELQIDKAVDSSAADSAKELTDPWGNQLLLSAH